MKILFIAPYPREESPSQRYRFEHYLPFLKDHNITYRYESFLDLKSWKIFFKPGRTFEKITGVLKGFCRRWLLMFAISKFDWVFIHREAAPVGPPVFEWIIAKLYKKKIIYDFDDAIWIPTASENNRIGYYLKWFKKIARICKWAHTVTAGNNYLAEFAHQHNSNVLVIPTVVNTETIHGGLQEQQTDQPTIGWTGSFSTLIYLEIILPALQRLQEKYDFTFVLIADKDPMPALKNYRFIPWNKATEAEDLLQIHIGVMPLFDDKFSRGKCGFKAIQYMALGIPAVVSPVGVNTAIVEDSKSGFYSTSTDEWEQKLEILLHDADLRQEMGKRAKSRIQLNYSVAATRDRFISLFKNNN